MNQDMRAKFLSTYPAAHSHDYDAMVQVEADEQMAVAGDLRTPKNQKAAELVAQERIQTWADGAQEYAISRGGFTLASFVASHRRACVWAVLIGREAAGEALRPAPTTENEANATTEAAQ